MPAPLFIAGNLAWKGAQAAGKTLLAGWKAGKVGAGNQIAGNTTAMASYGSSTIEPENKAGEDDKPKDNTTMYIVGGVLAAVLLFFVIKKK